MGREYISSFINRSLAHLVLNQLISESLVRDIKGAIYITANIYIYDEEAGEIFKVKKNDETIKGEDLHYEDLYNYAFVLGQLLLEYN